MIRHWVAGALACAVAGTAAIAADDPPPPPSPRPDFNRVRQVGEQGIRDRYFEIYAIGYTSGFQWGFAKPVIGRRTWGWIACGVVEGRARARSDSDRAPQRFWIMSDANGRITSNEVISSVSTCDRNPRVPLDPMLRPYQERGGGWGNGDGGRGYPDDRYYPSDRYDPNDRYGPAPRRDEGQQGGVAAELERLANLRDRGVITQAEFETAKRRLLYR